MYRLLLITCITLFFSCSKRENRKDISTYKIDLNKESSLSDLFEDWKAIPLETNDSILISNIDKIEISKENLFIADRKNMEIYRFDINGHFLHSINRQGAGPEEYIEISDFQVRGNSLYILSSQSRAINQYDLSGRFVRSYKLIDFYHYFDFLNDDTLVLYSAFSNAQLFNFQLYDIGKSKIIKSHSPFEKNLNFVLAKSPFSEDYPLSHIVTLPYDYTIYKLADTFSPFIQLEFNSPEKLPKEKKSFEQLRKELLGKPVVTMIDQASLSDSTLFISYNYKFSPYLSKIPLNQKQRSSTYTLKYEKDSRFPFSCAQPLCFHKNYLISFMPAYVVLQFNDQFLSDKNISGKLNGDDNPVIFFHKLKK